MIRRRKYNKTDIASNFSMLSYFFLRGRGGIVEWIITSSEREEEQKPFLTVSITDRLAEMAEPTVPMTSLYPPPCISFTEVLLAAGFAVSVLANVFLGTKLYKKNKEEENIFYGGALDPLEPYEMCGMGDGCLGSFRLEVDSDETSC